MEACIARKGCTSTRIQNARPLAIARASKPHVVLSSITSNLLAAGSALALTTPSIADLKKYQEEYERAAERAVAEAAKVTSQIQVPDVPSVDVTAIDASTAGDATPLIAGLAVGIAIAGAGIALLFGSKGPKVQGVSAAKAIDMLANDPSVELLDIRTQAEIKESGSPDLRSVKKPVITLPYVPTGPSTGGTIVLGWADKLRRSRKVNEETKIILLSTYTPESLAAAKLVTEVYPQSSAVYYVMDGTEGPKGWKASGLPWRDPIKLPIDFGVLKSLDLTGVAAGTERIVKKYQESPTLVNGAVAAVAVTAASVFLFTEMETILELVGVIAALQFLASKLLFAEDRQQTFRDLKTLITEKIAANEAGQDLQQLASTILDVDTVEEVAQISNSMSNGKNGSANGSANNVEEARQWIARWRAKNGNPVAVKNDEFATK